MKSSGPPKNFKNQLSPLFWASSVNFCQNFFNLSHETVSLKLQEISQKQNVLKLIAGLV
jgi:hypothetical protein